MGNSGAQLARVPLSVIRRRVDSFAADYRDARSEVSDSQTFWNDFFAIFGLSRRQVATFELIAKRASTGGVGRIDLLYPGEMAVEQKSAGEDLNAAMQQVIDYLPSLTKAEMPRLLVVCDFRYFQWQDLDSGANGRFGLDELNQNIQLFTWLAGFPRSSGEFENEEDVNLKATALLARLHDRLAELSYPEHALREWMTRILFMLFADDAEVWEPAAFHAWLALHTRSDGQDLGGQIAFLFQLLNTPIEARPSNLDDSVLGFTYINGDLFSEPLPIAACDEEVREALLEACRFNWKVISPAIFGSMFQNVMTPKERRQLGAHYTTEQNILKTIRPLFLNELEAELSAATTKPALERFIAKLGTLKFFDPAAGCGNFLIITYRELRRLEKSALQQLLRLQGKGEVLFDISLRLNVTIDQMYALELEEFPAKIARTALYLADHLANREASVEFGQHYVRFPIEVSPNIVQANALRNAWEDVIPAEECDYCFGNPPFVGHSKTSDEQKEDKTFVFERIGQQASRYGRLDFVACWFALAYEYGKNQKTRFAFVATNSITQGEQARTLGPLMQLFGFELDFAHRAFRWTSEARGAASVSVVILGFSYGHNANRRNVFDYLDPTAEPVELQVGRLNWYLIDAPHIYPSKHVVPLVDYVPRAITKGSQPTDGGHLMVADDELELFRDDEIASKYLRRYEQTTELLTDSVRWCLWLRDAPPSDLRNSRLLQSRLRLVASARRESATESVRRAASTPALFTQDRQPEGRFLAIPEVSTDNRDYIPMAFRDSTQAIAGNKLLMLADPPLWLFGILQSSMWMTWVRVIVGRLGTAFSISADIAYSAFPWPAASPTSFSRIEAAAREVLDARPIDETLDILYSRFSMPPKLVSAHARLDRVVDAAYGRHTHSGDGTRLPVLLRRYNELTGGELTLFE